MKRNLYGELVAIAIAVGGIPAATGRGMPWFFAVPLALVLLVDLYRWWSVIRSFKLGDMLAVPGILIVITRTFLGETNLLTSQWAIILILGGLLALTGVGFILYGRAEP
ncbi:MAG: hypothetical protein OWU33_09340 [Firmicutes bacterium]|nr:hypothetical protein [Bacillota bacterium]